MTPPTFNPQEAFVKLLDGNRRFVNGIRSTDTESAPEKMAHLAANGQRPFAIILTCSDSRIPTEMVFDQGIGDLFVVRVAGNVVAPSLLATIEFAVENFDTPLILVLGHTQCGAIQVTATHSANPTKPLHSPHLEELIGRIRPAVEATWRPAFKNEPDFLHQVTLENIRRSMRLIEEQSLIVRESIAKNKLAISGALLEINTGLVTPI